MAWPRFSTAAGRAAQGGPALKRAVEFDEGESGRPVEKLRGEGSLSYPPPEISKFEVVGGLFGEPVHLRRAETMDLDVPAWAEIVIEGEILPGEHEQEGPFGGVHRLPLAAKHQ